MRQNIWNTKQSRIFFTHGLVLLSAVLLTLSLAPQMAFAEGGGEGSGGGQGCASGGEVTKEDCQKCLDEIKESERYCKIRQVENAAETQVVAGAIKNNHNSGAEGAAGAASDIHQVGAGANIDASMTCHSAAERVKHFCGVALHNYQQYEQYLKSKNPKSPQDQAGIQAAQHNIKVVQQEKENAVLSLHWERDKTAASAQMAMQNAGGAADVQDKAASRSDDQALAPPGTGQDPNSEDEEEEGFLSRNKDLLIGGAIGAGGVCLLTDCFGGDDDEDKQANNDNGDGKDDDKDDDGKDDDEDETADNEDEDDKGFEAADCQGDEDYKKDVCQDYFVNTCKDNPGASNCDKFANNYCGLTSGADTSGGIVPSGQGTGTGSNYCVNVVKTRYCQTAGHEECPTCLQMQKSQTEFCQKNPSSCMGQYSSAELKNAQRTCPTDPMFSDPDVLARINKPNLGDGGAGLQPRSVPAGGAAVYKTGTATGSAGYQTFGVIGGRGPATGSEPSYPDISQPHGPSLFNKTSSVIQRLCAKGEIDKCPRGVAQQQ